MHKRENSFHNKRRGLQLYSDCKPKKNGGKPCCAIIFIFWGEVGKELGRPKHLGHSEKIKVFLPFLPLYTTTYSRVAKFARRQYANFFQEEKKCQSSMAKSQIVRVCKLGRQALSKWQFLAARCASW